MEEQPEPWGGGSTDAVLNAAQRFSFSSEASLRPFDGFDCKPLRIELDDWAPIWIIAQGRLSIRVEFHGHTFNVLGYDMLYDA